MFNAMSRAEIWLQDTLDQSLSIEDLANHLGYSASQIRRQFRHCFNTSPSSLSDLRLMDELRRGFFTPPCVGVGAVVWLLTCPSASARRF